MVKVHVRRTDEEGWSEYEEDTIAKALQWHFSVFYDPDDEVELEARWATDKFFIRYRVKSEITVTYLKAGIPEVED